MTMPTAEGGHHRREEALQADGPDAILGALPAVCPVCFETPPVHRARMHRRRAPVLALPPRLGGAR